ncbi:MAG: hypothetical protein R3Y32_08140 [Bacillota bacterium]
MSYPYYNANTPIYLAIASVVFIAMGIILHIASKKQIKVPKLACIATLFAFLAIRIYIAYKTESHADMTTFFLPWSYKLANSNFFEFYLADVATGEIEYLNDYPPMLMYVLYGIGKIAVKLNLSYDMWVFLMQIPAIICDVVASYYILKIAIAIENSKIQAPIAFESRKSRTKIESATQKESKESKGNKEGKESNLSITLANMPKKVSMFAFSCMVMYLANIAMITDSAWWGQVDGVIAMFFAITIYNVYVKKDTAVVVTAIVALCFKLQYIFFMPALGMYYIVRLIKEKKELFAKLLKGVVVGGVIFVAVNLPLCILPMTSGHPFFMIEIYINQVSNYAYYTLNAPNLFGALNLNFIDLPNNGTAWTLFVIGGISVVVAILSFCKNPKEEISILGALTIITVFMFSYKMHERYMIYALILLLIVYIQSGKLADLMVYCTFTAVQFYTIASIMCIDGSTFNFYDKRLQIISIICLTLYLGYVILISQAEVTARKSQLNKTLKK